MRKDLIYAAIAVAVITFLQSSYRADLFFYLLYPGLWFEFKMTGWFNAPILAYLVNVAVYTALFVFMRKYNRRFSATPAAEPVSAPSREPHA